MYLVGMARQLHRKVPPVVTVLTAKGLSLKLTGKSIHGSET